MAYTNKENFNVGSSPNDGQGDGLRTNLLKLIDNDEQLKSDIEENAEDLATLEQQFNNAGGDKVLKHNLGGESPVINNPIEGTGYADQVLFDLTKIINSGSFDNISDQGFTIKETATLTSDDYRNTPDVVGFAGAKVIHTKKYLTIKSDFIPVKPGEKLYGEMYARHISGDNEQSIYYGLEMYDADKKPIGENNGTVYSIADNELPDGSDWNKYSEYFTIPTTHTSYNDSNGKGVHYVKVRLLLNHLAGESSNDIRQYGGISLKRITIPHDLTVVGTITCTTLTQTSDRRLKQNITPIDGPMALEVFKKLNFSFYELSSGKVKSAGLIAQEVEEILPDAVHTSKLGEKSLNYNYIDMVCKAAIQCFINQQLNNS
jgi:hypothetical protein